MTPERREVRVLNLAAPAFEMRSEEVRAIISCPETLAKMDRGEPLRVRAYAIGHEGDALGNIVKLGRRAVQYMRETIQKIHDKLAIGTKVFSGHNDDNSHDGRPAIGKVVGKALREVGGRLYDVAAISLLPEAPEDLDVASFEATLVLEQMPDGIRAAEVQELTGIALGRSSAGMRPAFPGATLLGAFQAFEREGDDSVTKEELQEAIKKGNFGPLDLFDADTITGLKPVKDAIKTAKQTEYEHARRLEKSLGEEREGRAARESELSDELAKTRRENLTLKARPKFEDALGGRKLGEKAKAYVTRSFAKRFQVSDKVDDESKLAKEVDAFIDTEVEEFKEVAKGMGVNAEIEVGHPAEESPKGNEPASDAPGGRARPADYADPAKNDFI